VAAAALAAALGLAAVELAAEGATLTVAAPPHPASSSALPNTNPSP
jgi:hypothetical protein